MKKIVLGIMLLSSLVFCTDNKVINMQLPKLNAVSVFDSSFTLYKGSVCEDSAMSIFKPRCIELQFRKVFELDTKDAKFYTHEEAVNFYMRK